MNKIPLQVHTSYILRMQLQKNVGLLESPLGAAEVMQPVLFNPEAQGSLWCQIMKHLVFMYDHYKAVCDREHYVVQYTVTYADCYA